MRSHTRSRPISATRRPVSKVRRISVRTRAIENEVNPRQCHLAFMIAFFVAASTCLAIASICLILQPLS